MDDTIILFTGDHGDLLGDHGLYAKRYMYEWSARIPMILVGRAGDDRVGHHKVDDRPVGLQDVMPTLLDLAGIDIPNSCTGLSMIGEEKRDTLYCEALEGVKATRMVTDGRYKLIWYPCGNHVQLFDLDEDPRECTNLADRPDHSDVRLRLEAAMIDNLYGGDEDWVKDGRLAGYPSEEVLPVPNRDLSGQRGLHYPQLPNTDPAHIVGTP